jgi:hypothetical protein
MMWSILLLVAASGAAQPRPVVFFDGGFAGAALGSPEQEVTLRVANVTATTVALWNGEERPLRVEDGVARVRLGAEDLLRLGMSEIVLLDRATGVRSNPAPFHVWLPTHTPAVAYDRTHDRLYAASDSGSLFVIDPTAGSVLAQIQLAHEALQLRVSEGGRYLYTQGRDSVWTRCDLLADSPWLGAAVELFAATELQPLPGLPDSFAVARPFEQIIEIYDGVAPRRNSYGPIPPGFSHVIQFASASDLLLLCTDYGLPGLGLQGPETFLRLTITEGGLTLAAQETAAFGGYFATAARKIFLRSGDVLNLDDWQPEHTIEVVADMAPADAGRVALLVYGARLIMMDADSMNPLWVLLMPPVESSPFGRHMVPAGGGRMALSFSGYGLFITGKPSRFDASMDARLAARFEASEIKTFRLGITQEGNISLGYGFVVLSGENGRRPFGYSRSFVTPAELELPLFNLPTSLGTHHGGEYKLILVGAEAPATSVALEYEIVPDLPLHAEPAALEFRNGTTPPPPQTIRVTKEGAPVPVRCWLDPDPRFDPPATYFSVTPSGPSLTPVNFRFRPNQLPKGKIEEKWMCAAGQSPGTPIVLRIVPE